MNWLRSRRPSSLALLNSLSGTRRELIDAAKQYRESGKTVRVEIEGRKFGVSVHNDLFIDVTPRGILGFFISKSFIDEDVWQREHPPMITHGIESCRGFW